MSFENNVKNEYFEWLYNYVCHGKTNKQISYRKLFMLLHDTEFTFIVPNDINRARDGVDLRYRFTLTHDYDVVIYNMLDGPCSVLEMILALAIRFEETMMDNPQYGDRTSQWFWNMMINLGLGSMDDDHFDRRAAERIIKKFLFRQYEPNGRGGLFYIKNCHEDLRDLEIWDQLCWYSSRFV